MPASTPLVVHVVHRFSVGGLENGVVNLINNLSSDRWRHAVLALTGVDSEFLQRVTRDDTVSIELRKKPGHLVGYLPALHRMLRKLRPAIVHTRNLAALEAQVAAWSSAVPVRIHGEHGWDVSDLQGTRRRYRLIRAAYRPFVHHYIALSRHLQEYLTGAVGIPDERVEQIYNGVDMARFQPSHERREPIEGCPFTSADLWLVGSVGRMQAVKDQASLAHAFVRACRADQEAARRMRLVIAGDGPLKEIVESILEEGGVRALAWLPGERADIPAVLRTLDLFALPSLAEGISNTILEAMSTALPVVATRVGGNAELIEDGLTGALVPPANPDALATAMLRYFKDPRTARRHGKAGRSRVERQFSLAHMVSAYDRLYSKLLERRGAPQPSPSRA